MHNPRVASNTVEIVNARANTRSNWILLGMWGDLGCVKPTRSSGLNPNLRPMPRDESR